MDFHFVVDADAKGAPYIPGVPMPRVINTRSRLARVVREALAGRRETPRGIDAAASLPTGTTSGIADGERCDLSSAVKVLAALGVHPVTLPPIDESGVLL